MRTRPPGESDHTHESGKLDSGPIHQTPAKPGQLRKREDVILYLRRMEDRRVLTRRSHGH